MSLVTCLRRPIPQTERKRNLILRCTRCSSVVLVFNHIHHKYNVKSRAFDFQFLAIHSKFRGQQAPKFDSPQIVYNKSNWGPKEDISLGLLCVLRSALDAKVIDNGFHCIIMLLIQNHLN